MKPNNLSFWMQSLDMNPYSASSDPALLLPSYQCDVAIIGGGFSGLWLAYYLKLAQPETKIALFEAQHIGYGASGRNGGWLSSNIPSVINNLLKHPSITPAQIQLLQRQVIDTIDVVDDVCQQEQIDCDLHKGGLLFIATNEAQIERLQHYHESELAYGFAEHELNMLSAAESQQHINIPSMVAALHYQHGARIHPAKLALGLRERLLGMGVAIFENTPVRAFSKNHLDLGKSTVQADKILCCTEGYSDQILHNRKIIPVNSSIIMTKPLPESFWQRFGWQNNELLGDLAHLYIYAQKTRDKRILFGGRGAPYQYNSVDAGVGQLDGNTTQQLYQRLGELFPDTVFEIDRAWKGSLGVTRDWNPSVSYSAEQGLGFIYGFGGNGVGPTNLAARTMVDKICGRYTELTALSWNDYQCPTWEPEPFRWVGIQSMYKMLAAADKLEYGLKLKKSAFFAGAAYKICGLD